MIGSFLEWLIADVLGFTVEGAKFVMLIVIAIILAIKL